MDKKTGLSEADLTMIRQLVKSVTRQEFRAMLRELLTSGKEGKLAGDKVVKRSVSIPKSLSDAIDELPGPASAHITAAVKMYLKAREEAVKE